MDPAIITETLSTTYSSYFNNSDFSIVNFTKFFLEIKSTLFDTSNPSDLLKILETFFSDKMTSKFNYDLYQDLVYYIMTTKFTKKGGLLDAFFFPSKVNEQKMVDYINMAEKELLVAIFTMTNDSLLKALTERHKKGVLIRIVADDVCMKHIGSDINTMAKVCGVKHDGNKMGQMHNKYAVIDRKFIITGSFNWTAQAVKTNCENVIVIENEFLVDKYVDDFKNMWTRFDSNWVTTSKAIKEKSNENFIIEGGFSKKTSINI